VPVLLWVAIAVILIAVFFTATGRGGELAYEHADHAPLNLGSVSGADVALLRPPTALWGYNMQVTDAALDTIAQALRDRDVAIAHLQQQVTDLNYHVHGTTPAPPAGQDFPTRIDEGPPGFQPRPFPGRHEAQPPTPPEAWLAPAGAPAAESLPDPLVWEAPDPEPSQDQPWASPEDQESPSLQGQSWPARQDEPSPTARDRSWSDQQGEASPDPADQAAPRAVGFAPAPDAPVPDAPVSDAPAAAHRPGPSDPAVDKPAADGDDDVVEQDQ
jgi:hypothetical protein